MPNKDNSSTKMIDIFAGFKSGQKGPYKWYGIRIGVWFIGFARGVEK